MTEILFKVHKSYRTIISICDKDLIGKKFEEGIKQLDLTGKFYEGELLSEEHIKENIEEWKIEDATFNIVGENSIRIALETKIINKRGIMKVQGIPFALVLL